MGPWQREIESRAGIDLAFRPGATTMPPDDAANIGKTDACAFKFAHCVKPLKNAEELVDVCHIETDAIIADEDHRSHSIIHRAADLDLRDRPRTGELQSIGNQVKQGEP